MSDIPKISDAEWAVMEILWNEYPLSANEVFEKLKSNTNWQLKTLKTLLNRLVKKGAISFTQENRKYLYSPLVSKEHCMKYENITFLQKFYQGSVKKMFTSFAENENLSLEDIDELKKIIERKKEK